MVTPEGSRASTTDPIADGRFAVLARASALIVWTVGSDGLIIEDSPSWREFTGQTTREFLGVGWLDAIHPEDRAATACIWARAVHASEQYVAEYRLRHRSGEWRSVRSRGYPVLNERGDVASWVGLSDDLTERRRGRLALEESELQFRTLAEATPNLLWLADARAKIYYWNPSWLAYTGLSVAESCGAGALRVIHRDHRARALAALRNVAQTRAPVEMELRLRGQGGEFRWFLARLRPTTDDRGAVVRWAGFMTDIDDQRGIADRLRQERQNRERFVSTLVHDLKNAFGAGAAAMSALIEIQPQGSERAAFEGVIERAFQRANRMVEDLLDANHVDSGQAFPLGDTETFALGSCVANVAAALGTVTSARIDVDIPPDLEVTWSLKDTIRIVENLLSNAVKYGDGARPITVAAAATGGRVRWRVHNWGTPIPEDDRADLFTFLGRSPAARGGAIEGWGIGLTLVKGLVEAHAGTISVESGALTGTDFVLEMPRAL